jgi:hypothetical protein
MRDFAAQVHAREFVEGIVSGCAEVIAKAG